MLCGIVAPKCFWYSGVFQQHNKQEWMIKLPDVLSSQYTYFAIK